MPILDLRNKIVFENAEKLIKQFFMYDFLEWARVYIGDPRYL